MCVCVSAETLGKTELKKREGHFLYSDSGNGINTPSENVRSCTPAVVCQFQSPCCTRKKLDLETEHQS